MIGQATWHGKGDAGKTSATTAQACPRAEFTRLPDASRQLDRCINTHPAKLSRTTMGNNLSDLGKLVAATYAHGALSALAGGDVRAAHAKAVRALQMRLSEEDRQQLGKVFYAHGKLLTSEGQFNKATADFARAVDCSDRNETYRLRHRTAEKALKQSFLRVVSQGAKPITDAILIRRFDVVSFCNDMCAKHNLPLSDLPQAAILHYVQKAGYVYPSPVRLPEEAHLDEFHALGTYRWQGDEKSGDQFTRWVRRLKDGDKTVTEHLGRLLGDWIWSETDCVKDTDYLVTVPGGPQREAHRGFNPPEVLAKAVQDCLGVPLLLRVLKRDESSRARELNYQDVRACFSLGKAAQKINGRSVLLIDDVATRGYSLWACSELLRNAGAKRVVCIALAQAVSTLRERQALDVEVRVHTLV